MAMDRAGSGSRRSSFEALAAEVYQPLQRYVRRRVEIDAVDDVVSETMLTLWRRLEDVPEGAGLPWTYGIARRQIANHRRGVRRHLRLLTRVGSEPRHESEPDRPLDPEVHSALAALGETDREILRLWAWEQLEPAEISLVLGLTSNAVSIRLHRAKRKLGEYLRTVRKTEVLSGHSHREDRKEERP